MENSENNSVVIIKGKLPNSLEIRTSSILDILCHFLEPHAGESEHNFRERLQGRLYNKARPGFYFELNDHFHIAYAHQKDGHGTQHYWRVFYDDVYQEEIKTLAQGSALTISNVSQGAENARFEWGGLYLRSEAEVAIAKELGHRGLLFFANVRGRVGLQHSPVAEQQSNGRIELDFLVFKNGKCVVLEIDGIHHNDDVQRLRDYARDRLMLREGIPTARFTAQEYLNTPADVINEFLRLIS